LGISAVKLGATDDAARVLLARYRALEPADELDFRFGGTARALPLLKLIEAPVLEERLQALAESTGGKMHIAGLWMVGDLAWWIGGLALAGLVTERRILLMDAMHISVDHDEGFISAATSQSAGVGVLAGDEMAPVATISFPSEAAMRAYLYGFLRKSLTPFASAIRERVRISRRALMGHAEATWGSALTHWTRLIHKPAQGHDEVGEFFSVTNPKPWCPPTTYDVSHKGRTYVGLKRGVCCLAYKIDESYPYCGGCPLITERERGDRIRSWMEEGRV
jgi:hypothetical protein